MDWVFRRQLPNLPRRSMMTFRGGGGSLGETRTILQESVGLKEAGETKRLPFPRYRDDLLADLAGRCRWTLAYDERLGRVRSSWLLANNERRRWWRAQVRLLDDHDVTRRRWSRRTQVPDGELLHVLDRLVSALANHVRVGVFIDLVLVDRDWAFC